MSELDKIHQHDFKETMQNGQITETHAKTETKKDGNLEKELPTGKSVNKVFNNKVKKAAPKMF